MSSVVKFIPLAQDNVSAQTIAKVLAETSWQIVEGIEELPAISSSVKLVVKDLRKVNAELSRDHMMSVLSEIVHYRFSQFEGMEGGDVDANLWNQESLLKLKTLLGPSLTLRLSDSEVGKVLFGCT